MSGTTDQFDDLDDRIALALKSDGRQSAQAIAEIVGASAVTVRNRIKSMTDAGHLKIAAVTDFAAAGFEVLMMIGVEVDKRKPEEVGEELAKFDRVLAVNLTTGANDLEILVGAPDMASVSAFMQDEIGAVAGVGKLSTAVALEVYKYQADTVTTAGRED
ncbi:MAG: Lrp/AsnC family transcriptional regulator [Pseudomonadota bacterium]